MQRIAVLLLWGSFGVNVAEAGPCDAAANVVGGFVGGATGFTLSQALGPATGWLSAGLYGAGVAAAAYATRSGIVINCDSIISLMRRFGELQCLGSEFDYDCGEIRDMSLSLAGDMAICPLCTYDEVFGMFPLPDLTRQHFLQAIQLSRAGTLARVTQVIPRDRIVRGNSVSANAYFVGLSAGLSRMSALKIAFLTK